MNKSQRTAQIEQCMGISVHQLNKLRDQAKALRQEGKDDSDIKAQIFDAHQNMGIYISSYQLDPYSLQPR